MCAYMGRNTKMANRAASRQKDGRWGPPGPSPLKQVTLAIQLVDDILVVKPVVVLADVLLVCTSGSAEVLDPCCQPCDSSLDELVVVPNYNSLSITAGVVICEPLVVATIDDLPFITAVVVTCVPLVVLDKGCSKLLCRIDVVDEYLVVGPVSPSNDLNLIDTTLEMGKTVDLRGKTLALLMKDHYNLFCSFIHQKFVNVFVNVWAKWYLAITPRFLICYFLAPDFIRNGIG